MKRYKLLLNGSWQDSENHLTVSDPATGGFAEVAMIDRGGQAGS